MMVLRFQGHPSSYWNTFEPSRTMLVKTRAITARIVFFSHSFLNYIIVLFTVSETTLENLNVLGRTRNKQMLVAAGTFFPPWH